MYYVAPRPTVDPIYFKVKYSYAYQDDITDYDSVFPANFVKIFSYKRRKDQGAQLEAATRIINSSLFLP
jgi:hypothetical protein